MLTRKQTRDWFDQCDAMLKKVSEIAVDMQELSQVGSRYGDEAARLSRQAKTASDTTHRLWNHMLKMLHTAGDLAATAIADGDQPAR